MSAILNRLTHFANWLGDRWPWFARAVNNFAINDVVNSTRNRPHPWSTASDYISWKGLTDRSWSARHLPPRDLPDLPEVEAVAALFAKTGPDQVECPKSTCLFPAFAQYLTDGFIRTHVQDPEDRRKTTSNHEIDQSPLYGRTEEQTRVLRLGSEQQGQKGRLLSQIDAEGEEWPCFLYLVDGESFDPRFLDGEGRPVLDAPLGISHASTDQKRTLFAVGGDRANATAQVSMINALFLREHNRLAGKIEAQHPGWDDEHVFQVARNIVIVMFIKIVVEEYINHIAPTGLKLRADPACAWSARWNRPNWITAEFSLLYRWHSLVPEKTVWNATPVDAWMFQLNNAPLLGAGLAKAFEYVAAQPTAALGLGNSADFLVGVEKNAVLQARTNRIASYNDYRALVGMKRAASFRDVTRDEARQRALALLYASPDELEFYVGLFAEDRVANSPLPGLILKMVAIDAFSQAMTNPLLSKHIYGDPVNSVAAFTQWGLDEIRATGSLADILGRNSNWDAKAPVAMTRADWVPV
ncbi:peroxidase family protein [Sphingomonas sp. SUN039]|uniref:peroxidase family protein n=1 Tax=Sphingomonas sp. SUN039 TaxID=2937787 RepID=UPI002164A25C|nr:peroxidase family protein [Sphingomonas sp. SUN039]UVO54458.1 heme peroxidase [Sphingomonas sp. SUN039]